MHFFNTNVSKTAAEDVAKTLESTFLSEGKRVLEFEEKLAEQLKLQNPVAVNSGTTALHLGLVLAGVAPGDEVILPAQTFVATGLVILMCGATPVFADIQLDTGNLCPKSVEEKVTERTKAIMPVHWAGLPCDMDEINAVAIKHNLAVIEDAAHALGATYKGAPIGAVSRFTAFSFQAIKHLTTGDGGCLCSLDAEDARRAKVSRWFGIDRANSKPSILGEREYDIAEIGFKYHLNDYAATLGLANLKDFSENLAKHREIAAQYREQLSDIKGLELLSNPSDRESSHWLFSTLVERREDFARALKARGIPTSIVHRRIDGNTIFGGINSDLKNQHSFNEKHIALPIHSALRASDIYNITKGIKAGW